MNPEHEQAIRDRAYAIWEEGGRPFGKAVDHWMGAEAEIMGASQDGVPDYYRAIANELVTVHMRLMQMEEPLISQSGPVRRLSAVIRSAAALLMVPINLAVPNSIGASLHKDSDRDYQDLLISIYRCTMTGAHIYFEDSLHEWCEQNNVPIESSLHRKWASVRTKIAAELSKRSLKLFDGLEPPKAPTAPDVIRAATSVLSKDRAAIWLDYLDAVAIIRNKLSHSRPSLSVSQQDRLRKAGLGSIINENALLRFDAHMLPNTIQNLINFFGEIEMVRSSRKTG